MFKMTIIRKDKLKSIENKLGNLEKEIKRLKCSHRYIPTKEFGYYISTRYVYYNKCRDCDKEVAISEREYIKAKLEEAQKNVRIAKEGLNKLKEK